MSNFIINPIPTPLHLFLPLSYPSVIFVAFCYRFSNPCYPWNPWFQIFFYSSTHPLFIFVPFVAFCLKFQIRANPLHPCRPRFILNLDSSFILQASSFLTSCLKTLFFLCFLWDLCGKTFSSFLFFLCTTNHKSLVFLRKYSCGKIVKFLKRKVLCSLMIIDLCESVPRPSWPCYPRSRTLPPFMPYPLKNLSPNPLRSDATPVRKAGG